MPLQYDETDISLKGANYLNSQIYYFQFLKTAAEKGKLANLPPHTINPVRDLSSTPLAGAWSLESPSGCAGPECQTIMGWQMDAGRFLQCWV